MYFEDRVSEQTGKTFIALSELLFCGNRCTLPCFEIKVFCPTYSFCRVLNSFVSPLSPEPHNDRGSMQDTESETSPRT